jgi:phage terminase large subunit
MNLNCEFPDKLGFLFKPARYKVARGGRGSGKSWGFARALLILGVQNVERVLCTREIQKSIKQSVHQLIRDQIQTLGLSHFYEVLETEIRGKNGTRFYFAGLSDQTADSIKSFEGCTKVWVEEGQNTSKRSWEILAPTIREKNSEIWCTYNPELDTDPTHVRFVMQPPDDCVSVIMNWRDNPWFPEVLEKERQDSLKRDPEGYNNIWEGDCKPAVTGAIYYNEVAAAESEQRIRDVPYDPLLKVHAIWDLGWNDSMAIILAQRVASELRVIDYIEDSHRTLDSYVMELKNKNLNLGISYLPHDGFSRDFKTGKSAEEIVKALGLTVERIPMMDIEGGIKAARMTFNRMYFDKNKTVRLIECLKRYRRQINKSTNEAGSPLHDEYSHGADVFRYLALVVDGMTNDSGTIAPIKYRTRTIA